MSQRIGTPLFMAPELFTSGNYTTSVDVFSYAVCAATFFTRAPPFSGPETQDLSAYELIEQILSGLRPTLPDACPKNLQSLIQQCWHVDPKCRPAFSQIVEALQSLDCANEDCANDAAASSRFDDDRLVSTGTTIVAAEDGDTWGHGHQYRNEDDEMRVTNDLDDMDSTGNVNNKMARGKKRKEERVDHRIRHQMWMASPQMNTVIPPAAAQVEKGAQPVQPKPEEAAAASSTLAELPKPPHTHGSCSHVVTASFSSTNSSVAPHSRAGSNQSNVTATGGERLSTDWHRSVIRALRTESFDMRQAVHVPAEFTYSFEASVSDAKTLAEKEKLALQLGTEWIYMQLSDLFNDLTALVNVFGDCCTESSCPTMSAGPAFTYCLKCGDSAKEDDGTHEVSAPRYVNISIGWIEDQLTCLEELCEGFETPELSFCRDARASFISGRTLSTNSSARHLSSSSASKALTGLSKNTKKKDAMSDEEIARMVRARGLAVARQLFVMFAHMYHSHLEEIIALRMHSHMNTTLRMFVLFNKENDLMPVEEMQPLAGIVKGILAEFDESD
jgi:hypothetical protein